MDIHVSVCTCMNIHVCMLSVFMCVYPCICVRMCVYTRVWMGGWVCIMKQQRKDLSTLKPRDQADKLMEGRTGRQPGPMRKTWSEGANVRRQEAQQVSLAPPLALHRSRIRVRSAAMVSEGVSTSWDALFSTLLIEASVHKK